MNKKIFIPLLFSVIFSHNLFGALTQKEQQNEEENRRLLELKEKEKIVQTVKGIEQDVKKNLNELKNFQISMSTKNISISNTSIIDIDFHHMHFTKIYFPTGTTIIEAKATMPMKDIEIFSNRLELRPNHDLLQGSISVSFIYKSKPYDITIIANKYDISSNRNAFDNVFYPKINIIIEEPTKPKDIIKKYREDYGTLPTKPLTFFEIGTKVYIIERGTFETNDPNNKPNLFVLHQGETIKYKIAQQR